MKKIFIQIILLYFKTLAKWQLAKNKPLIIGVTGTAGKTSTRDAIAAVLKNKFKLKVSYKANSETGIPLNILDLSPNDYSVFDWLRLIIQAPLQLLFNWSKYDVYLVELGIDSPFPPKNMGYLLTIVQPNIGVFTNVGLVHSFTFDPLVKETEPEQRKKQIKNLIAQEKGRLIKGLPKNGLAVLNLDDPLVGQFAKQTQATPLTIGFNPQAQLHIKSIQQTIKRGSEFNFSFQPPTTSSSAQQKQHITLHLPSYILPDHFAYTLANALAVAWFLGINLDQAVEQLIKNFNITPGRASFFAGINQSHIIDSSYNSSTQTVIDTLALAKKLVSKRLVVVLGDIREMGDQTASEHQLVAAQLLKTLKSQDLLILVGPQMKNYAVPMLTNKIPQLRWFSTAWEAAAYLPAQIQKDDLIMVKGSQNTIFLEIVVKALLADPSQEHLLCRRGEFWDQQRAKLK